MLRESMSPTVLQSKRNQQILTELVRVYIETGEPVSSRSVARRHVEALSSATIRNVMADLEEKGWLYQPHTSAGRVPTAEVCGWYSNPSSSRSAITLRIVAELSASTCRRATLRDETGSPVLMYTRTRSVKICWLRFDCRTVGLIDSLNIRRDHH